MAVQQSEYAANLVGAPFDELVDSVEQLHALEISVRSVLLPVVRELSRHESALAGDGAKDVGGWLSMRLGISYANARDVALVADALSSLPEIEAAFISGKLSWEKLVLVCQVATPETDAAYAADGPSMTITQLRELARRTKEVKDEDVVEAHEARSLIFRNSRCGRFLRFDGRLPVDQGAVVRSAVERIGDSQGPELDGGYLPAHQRNADALVEICSTEIAEDADADRATVVIDADISILDGIGNADIDGAGPISPETVKRVLCDSRLQIAVVEDAKTVGFGRTVRTFPAGLMRRIRKRDQSCRFPGCHRRRWVQGHHIQHWTDDGPTDEDNGLLLCSHHHRFFHEHHWRIEGSPYGALRFIRPDGRVFSGMPPPLRADVRERFGQLDTG